jgi:diguanylate cyclase (GGDEF)-like protein
MARKFSSRTILIGSILFYLLLILISSLTASANRFENYLYSLLIMIHILLLYLATYPSFENLFHFYLAGGIVNLYLFRNIFLHPEKNEILYLSVYLIIYGITFSARKIILRYRDSLMEKNIAPRLGEFIKTKFEIGEKNDQLGAENVTLTSQKNNRDWIYTQAKRIIATLDFEEMTELAQTILTGIKGINNYLFFLKKEKKGSYEQIFHYSISTEMQGYLKSFLREKGEDFFNDITSYVKSDIEIKEFGYDLTALNLFPLILKAETIGILLQFETKEFTATKNVINSIKIVSRYLAMGVKKSLLYNKVQLLSRRDGLTSLLLRRIFDESLQQEFQRSRRYNSKLSLIMLDIDFFKKLNDTYGHLFGDRVLQQLAGIIQEMIKTPLSAFRYGGEEFAILCPNMDKEESSDLAERIRSAVKERTFEHEGTQVRTAISGGVAEFHSEMKKEDELLKSADEKLYQAKESGRDRIEK